MSLLPDNLGLWAFRSVLAGNLLQIGFGNTKRNTQQCINAHICAQNKTADEEDVGGEPLQQYSIQTYFLSYHIFLDLHSPSFSSSTRLSRGRTDPRIDSSAVSNGMMPTAKNGSTVPRGTARSARGSKTA
mmetsp:Transcript_9286/g.22657  ORF Transcript_9286/g.22657 Transcript_9286/m.22657 type:complete len:130 (+) Transcript_9286:302-691(+)